MPSARLEIVTYNTPAMIHTSRELILDYARYANPKWVTESDDFLFRVTNSIVNHGTNPTLWRTPGMHISFSGYPQHQEILREDQVLFEAPSPHFTLVEDLAAEIRPVERTHILRVAEAIAEEMNDVYKMDVNKKGLTLTMGFPKERYSEKIEIVQAAVV